MNLRVFVIVLLMGVFAACVAFVALAMAFMKVQLAPLVPPGSDADILLRWLIIGGSVGAVVFSVTLIGTVYWIIGKYVVMPLRGIIATMEAFAEARPDVPLLPDISGAPDEVRSLASVFARFVDSVEQAHQRDVEMSRVKSDFISTAAHQLRTPLTGIRWALEALEKEPLAEGQKALVASAVDKSRQLVSIVGTLLDISSIESGKYKYTFAPTDMEEVCEAMVKDFGEMAARSNVSVSYEKSEAPLPKARVDRDRIKWVLSNLIENGIRYTPAGGNVRVKAYTGAGRVYVDVHDTGIGILPKDRGNIFERFYRAENAITKENAGNGLGLYIARTIATDHGGDLNFKQNEEGPGTTFTLSVPVSEA